MAVAGVIGQLQLVPAVRTPRGVVWVEEKALESRQCGKQEEAAEQGILLFMALPLLIGYPVQTDPVRLGIDIEHIFPRSRFIGR